MATRPPSSGHDVIIIGGGIIGVCTAWHLAKLGAGSILLLYQSLLASGATWKTGALLRQHYTNEPEALLAHHSLTVYKNWPEIVGGDCGHVPSGLIATVETRNGNESSIERMRRNIAMQNRIGIDSRAIFADELQKLQPFARADDIDVVAYEPGSGYVDSIAACRSMGRAAMSAGVEIRETDPVLTIASSDSRVTGVCTADGVIAARAVVCAAGPWSTRLCRSVDMSIPITTLRVQVAIVQRPLEFEQPHFVYVDTVAGMFTRPWGPGRSLIGVAGGDQHDEVDPDDYDMRNDLDYPRQAISAAAGRIPAMARASYIHGHAGLYDMTPDAHPIISGTPLEGLYIAAGFSGAGFKKGPAVGQSLAELIVHDRSSLVDLHPFRFSRFDTEAWRDPWSDTEYTFSSDFGHKF